MHRFALAALRLVVVFSAIPAFAAEPIVVNLFPGKSPADVGLKEKESTKIHPSPIVGPTPLISNVTKPTLTVYEAPSASNTGTAMITAPVKFSLLMRFSAVVRKSVCRASSTVFAPVVPLWPEITPGSSSTLL